MKLFEWVKSLKIWMWLTASFVFLLGLLRLSDYRLRKAKEESDEVKRQMDLQEINTPVVAFNAINVHEKKEVDDVEKNNDDTLTLQPDTTYRL